MAKTKKRAIGDVGEGVVCRFLKTKGYKIVERNYWKPWGEIDIVAEKAGIVRFVEVKSVSREAVGEGISHETGFRPEENMHPAKVQRLHRAIQTYLMDHNIPENKGWQLDLACAYLDFPAKKAKVELVENVIL